MIIIIIIQHGNKKSNKTDTDATLFLVHGFPRHSDPVSPKQVKEKSEDLHHPFNLLVRNQYKATLSPQQSLLCSYRPFFFFCPKAAHYFLNNRLHIFRFSGKMFLVSIFKSTYLLICSILMHPQLETKGWEMCKE